MLLTISFLSGLVGICFAGAAALLPDTGIDGTLGSFLALLGTVAVALAVGMLATGKVPSKTRGVLVGLAALFSVLTALAAWFLMQDTVLATMVVSLLALLMSSATAKRKTTI